MLIENLHGLKMMMKYCARTKDVILVYKN